jgi:CBS domain-containing protein
MSEVKEIMRTHRISGIPIVDEKKLVGIISVASLICALERGEMDVPVSQFMTQNIVTCRAQEPVFEALKRLDETGFGRLPVIEEDGSLVGILTKGDVMAGCSTLWSGSTKRLSSLSAAVSRAISSRRWSPMRPA